MVAQNITIFIIILVMFIVLTAVGFSIWFFQAGLSRIGRRARGSGSSSLEEV